MQQQKKEDVAQSNTHYMGAHPFFSALWAAGEDWTELSQHTTQVGRVAGSVNSQHV